MRAQRLITIIIGLSFALAAMALPPSGAGTTAHRDRLALDPNTQCTGTLVVDFSYTFLHYLMSSTPIGLWSTAPTETSHIQAWQTGPSSFCTVTTRTGTFTTVAGRSPNNTGVVPNGLSGTWSMRWVSTFSATFDSSKAPRGDLGTFDAQCTVTRPSTYHCASISLSFERYFTNFSQIPPPLAIIETYRASNGTTMTITEHETGGQSIVGDIVAMPKPPAATNDCPAVELIGSRGSGDALIKDQGIGAPGVAFRKALENDLHLSSIKVFANPYAATAAIGSPTTVQIGLEPKLWFAGVQAGETWLEAKLRAEIAFCKQTRIYLVGYSQGAEVTGDVFATLGATLRSHIAGVVLFGDTRYNHRSFAGTTTPYQQSVQGGLKHDGIFGPRAEFPVTSRSVVLSYCHANDPICQGWHEAVHFTASHTNYASTNDPGNAASWFARLAARTPIG